MKPKELTLRALILGALITTIFTAANDIVQTVASAAGTLSAIIFVLPGLVIVGWWTGFPFWQSFLICLSGGVLGFVGIIVWLYGWILRRSKAAR